MDEKTIDAIHRLMGEISETKLEARTIKESIADILEQNDEYKAIQEEIKQLTAKRVELKKILDADMDYKKFASELEEIKFKLKDLQEILSHHLVTYYRETQNTQIKDPDGEVRTVILSAKIGKPEAITPQE